MVTGILVVIASILMHNINTKKYHIIIIGAGAAGMMSAIEAGKRGRKVLLVDHYKKIGEKIRISGGGRCNFTNINTNPNKISFTKSKVCKICVKSIYSK